MMCDYYYADIKNKIIVLTMNANDIRVNIYYARNIRLLPCIHKMDYQKH